MSISTRSTFRVWLAFAFLSLLLIGLSIRWADMPIALYFSANASRFTYARIHFTGLALVTAEMAVLICLGLVKLIAGELAEWMSVLVFAICTSVAGFIVNDHVLKLIFGRIGPAQFYTDHQSTFHFFAGSHRSNFPSGHMVLAAAFAVTVVRVYPKTWPIFAGLLLSGAIILLITDTHFMSDIIAGLLVGATAGVIAGGLWLRYNPR